MITPFRPRRLFILYWFFVCGAFYPIGVRQASAQEASVNHGVLTLWFDQPAKMSKEGWNGKNWLSLINEGLPIGNSRMGGLIMGGTAQELIHLNEDSLWTGGLNPSGNYGSMGSYQTLGELVLTLPGHETVTQYGRDLDLSQSLAHVSYACNGVNYRREYFCSQPAGVLVMHLMADKPGSYTGALSFKDGHDAISVVDKNQLTCAGALSNGLKYETQILVQNEGGMVQASDQQITFKDCDSVTVLITAGTDYLMDFSKGYRGDPPHDRLSQRMQAAGQMSYDALRSAHIADYKSLFNRTTLDLGGSTAEQRALPTNLRKAAAAKITDLEFEQLLFQYGRYLVISCSRPGGLPSNLQGLWNDNNAPAWYSDYHSNINVQMNYWPVEVTNLAECHRPFLDLIQSQLPAWRSTTALSKDFMLPSGQMTSQGWAVRTSHNIFGGEGWNWDNTANAWYCQHFWEHYAFSGDKAFLANVAYPVMKETCQFWEAHLKTLPDGRLVVPNAWSPEHGPREDGVSYSQEIVWDLFNNYVEAADVLATDKEYRDLIAGMRDKLATPGIGSWGQLLEWMTEKKNMNELDTPNDHHRHTSHLFGVFPGRQISLVRTPDLAAAAKVSLLARGDTGEVKEWSYAWRTALAARLHDGEWAHDQIRHFLGTTTLNLFGFHGPMQIDGNFGVTAGIAEVLLQSHEGEINFLPALPKDWVTGSVKGLCARGGLVVDLIWKDGLLQSATLHSTSGTSAKIRYGEKTTNVKLAAGGSVTLNGDLQAVGF